LSAIREARHSFLALVAGQPLSSAWRVRKERRRRSARRRGRCAVAGSSCPMPSRPRRGSAGRLRRSRTRS
jgi:hypothetical protein